MSNRYRYIDDGGRTMECTDGYCFEVSDKKMKRKEYSRYATLGSLESDEPGPGERELEKLKDESGGGYLRPRTPPPQTHQPKTRPTVPYAQQINHPKYLLKQPVTFNKCGQCNSNTLRVLCPCTMARNYVCDQCGWYYITHAHEGYITPKTGQQRPVKSVKVPPRAEAVPDGVNLYRSGNQRQNVDVYIDNTGLDEPVEYDSQTPYSGFIGKGVRRE